MAVINGRTEPEADGKKLASISMKRDIRRRGSPWNVTVKWYKKAGTPIR